MTKGRAYPLILRRLFFCALQHLLNVRPDL